VSTAVEQNGTKVKAWTPDRNKQIIDTGHTLFDRQTVCISPGNMLAPTQVSGIVRSWKEPKNPAQQPVEPGVLTNFDLDAFSDMFGDVNRWSRHLTGWQIRDSIRERTKMMPAGKMFTLYFFYHTVPARITRNRNVVIRHAPSHRVVHAIVLTHNNDIVQKWIPGPTYKSYDIYAECMKYVVPQSEWGKL